MSKRSDGALVRQRNDAAAVGLAGPGRERDLPPVEPHGKGDDARYRCPQAQAACRAASKGKGEPRGPTASGKSPPETLRRRPGRRQANIAPHIPVGGSEGDELVVETPGGNGEDRPLPAVVAFVEGTTAASFPSPAVFSPHLRAENKRTRARSCASISPAGRRRGSVSRERQRPSAYRDDSCIAGISRPRDRW